MASVHILHLLNRECQEDNSGILAANATSLKGASRKIGHARRDMAFYNVLPAAQRLDSIIWLDVSVARAMTPLRPMHVRDYRPRRKRST